VTLSKPFAYDGSVYKIVSPLNMTERSLGRYDGHNNDAVLLEAVEHLGKSLAQKRVGHRRLQG
jgi:hypothetical protein